MLVAAEPSGDTLAAELVEAWRRDVPGAAPRFFGAGGARLREAGVELAFDLTRHAIIGVPGPRDYLKFRGLRDQLVGLASERRPGLFIGVDAFAFNGSLARKIRQSAGGDPSGWRPRIAQYVSPQVWASRPGRAARMESTHDLLVSILPFEPAWYRRHAPKLAVEFVGHPLVDRCGGHPPAEEAVQYPPREILVLPGSRSGELRRHIPVMVPAARRAARETGLGIRMILPTEALTREAEGLMRSADRSASAPSLAAKVALQTGGLREALAGPAVAVASTGTVTLECAWHGVPTVAIYKASRLTYLIGKRIVTVRHLAMPNLLAGGLAEPPPAGFQPVMTELIQDAATPSAIAAALLTLAGSAAGFQAARRSLLGVASALGPPGASSRAALVLARLMNIRGTMT